MRGMGEMDELLKQMLKLGGPILAAMADDAVGDMNVMEIIPEEFIALLYGEKMNRALGDAPALSSTAASETATPSRAATSAVTSGI